MQKFSKPILIAVGSIVGLSAIGLLAINLYLQSKEVQNRIQEAASHAAGMPLRIQGTSFTPWSGVSVSGITASPKDSKSTPFLDVSSVSVGFRFLSLLSGKIVISDVLLTNPLITSVQRPDGSWAPPQRYGPADLPAAAPSPEPSQTTNLPSATAGKETSNAPQPVVAKPTSPRQQVEIENLRIRNGRVLFYDKKGALVIALEGISLNGQVPANGPATGYVKIRRATFWGAIRPTSLGGHFRWLAGNLEIPDLTGRWAEGTLTGMFKLDPPPANQFAAKIAANNIALKQLAEDAGMDGDGKKGNLFINAHLTGTPGHTDSFTGKAEASLREARLQPLDFIRQIGELLQIEELQMLKLKTAEAFFSIRDSKVVTDSLVLQSENLVIDAEGPMEFDGKLKLKARLHVNEKLRKESHGLIGNNFEKSDREGYTQMPFTITGTLSRPKTDLLDKLTGFRIGQDLGGLLKNLFRAPPAKAPKEAPKEAAPSVPEEGPAGK